MIPSGDLCRTEGNKVRRKNTLCVRQQLVRPANNHFVKVLKMSSFSSEWSFPHVASDCGDLESRSRERWRRRSSESRQANIKRLMRASARCTQPSHATQLQNCSKFISHSSRCNTSILTFLMKEVKLLDLHPLLLFPVTSKLQDPNVIWTAGWDRTAAATEPHMTDSSVSSSTSTTTQKWHTSDRRGKRKLQNYNKKKKKKRWKCLSEGKQNICIDCGK